MVSRSVSDAGKQVIVTVPTRSECGSGNGSCQVPGTPSRRICAQTLVAWRIARTFSRAGPVRTPTVGAPVSASRTNPGWTKCGTFASEAISGAVCGGRRPEWHRRANHGLLAGHSRRHRAILYLWLRKAFRTRDSSSSRRMLTRLSQVPLFRAVEQPIKRASRLHGIAARNGQTRPETAQISGDAAVNGAQLGKGQQRGSNYSTSAWPPIANVPRRRNALACPDGRDDLTTGCETTRKAANPPGRRTGCNATAAGL